MTSDGDLGIKPAKPKKRRRRTDPAAPKRPAELPALGPPPHDPASTARNPSVPRLVLLAAATMLALGLALTGVDASTIGQVLALAGLLGMIYGIHSFGRLGPDTQGDPR